MSKTINDFSDFFKHSDNQKLSQKSISFDLHKSVRNATELLKASFIHHQIKLILKLEQKQVKIFGDERKFIQAIVIILENAQYVLCENKVLKPKITISTKITSENIILLISDNGGGIPQEIINKIFEPYFTTREKSNGTGLGLYISKNIFKQHLNGNIYSTNNNEGAEFKIILPVY